MKWRIAENEANLATEPWPGAIGIEDISDEELAVPPIVAWTTRGGDNERNARLIAAAPELCRALRNAWEIIATEAPGYRNCLKTMADLLERIDLPGRVAGDADGLR